jgi:hypothetical protein
MSPGLPFLVLGLVGSAATAQREVVVVPREEILEAMRESDGYRLMATTNGARFQAETLLSLARRAERRDAERRPLRLGHAEWFAAYLARTGLPAEKAPTFVRLAYENGQDMEVDYRRERVIESPSKPGPEAALNVVIWWSRRPDGRGSYSYEDLLATPHLRVTNERVITYRLVDFRGMTLYDEIDGLKGRPLSGLLSVLFRLIGEGQVVQNRMIISEDGLQISRARAEKAFMDVTSTVTVYPDGRTEKDVPEGRPDLVAIEARLKQPLELRYRALDGAVRDR